MVGDETLPAGDRFDARHTIPLVAGTPGIGVRHRLHHYRAPDASRDHRLRLLCCNSRRQRQDRMAHVPGNSSAALLVELHFVVQSFDYFVQKQQSERLLTV